MKVLGIDYGQKRVGLALAAGDMAFPYQTLPRTSRLLDDLQRIIQAEGVEALVLGLPLDMDGQETLTTRQVRNFHSLLAHRTGLPVHLVNEALTSFEARDRLRAAGVPAHKHKTMLDQMAAVCILETFLGGQ